MSIRTFFSSPNDRRSSSKSRSASHNRRQRHEAAQQQYSSRQTADYDDDDDTASSRRRSFAFMKYGASDKRDTAAKTKSREHARQLAMAFSTDEQSVQTPTSSASMSIATTHLQGVGDFDPFNTKVASHQAVRGSLLDNGGANQQSYSRNNSGNVSTRSTASSSASSRHTQSRSRDQWDGGFSAGNANDMDFFAERSSSREPDPFSPQSSASASVRKQRTHQRLDKFVERQHRKSPAHNPGNKSAGSYSQTTIDSVSTSGWPGAERSVISMPTLPSNSSMQASNTRQGMPSPSRSHASSAAPLPSSSSSASGGAAARRRMRASMRSGSSSNFSGGSSVCSENSQGSSYTNSSPRGPTPPESPGSSRTGSQYSSRKSRNLGTYISSPQPTIRNKMSSAISESSNNSHEPSLFDTNAGDGGGFTFDAFGLDQNQVEREVNEAMEALADGGSDFSAPFVDQSVPVSRSGSPADEFAVQGWDSPVGSRQGTPTPPEEPDGFVDGFRVTRQPLEADEETDLFNQPASYGNIVPPTQQQQQQAIRRTPPRWEKQPSPASAQQQQRAQVRLRNAKQSTVKPDTTPAMAFDDPINPWKEDPWRYNSDSSSPEDNDVTSDVGTNSDFGVQSDIGAVTSAHNSAQFWGNNNDDNTQRNFSSSKSDIGNQRSVSFHDNVPPSPHQQPQNFHPQQEQQQQQPQQHHYNPQQQHEQDYQQRQQQHYHPQQQQQDYQHQQQQAQIHAQFQSPTHNNVEDDDDLSQLQDEFASEFADEVRSQGPIGSSRRLSNVKDLASGFLKQERAKIANVANRQIDESTPQQHNKSTNKNDQAAFVQEQHFANFESTEPSESDFGARSDYMTGAPSETGQSDYGSSVAGAYSDFEDISQRQDNINSPPRSATKSDVGVSSHRPQSILPISSAPRPQRSHPAQKPTQEEKKDEDIEKVGNLKAKWKQWESKGSEQKALPSPSASPARRLGRQQGIEDGRSKVTREQINSSQHTLKTVSRDPAAAARDERLAECTGQRNSFASFRERLKPARDDDPDKSIGEAPYRNNSNIQTPERAGARFSPHSSKNGQGPFSPSPTRAEHSRTPSTPEFISSVKLRKTASPRYLQNDRPAQGFAQQENVLPVNNYGQQVAYSEQTAYQEEEQPQHQEQQQPYHEESEQNKPIQVEKKMTYREKRELELKREREQKAQQEAATAKKSTAERDVASLIRRRIAANKNKVPGTPASNGIGGGPSPIQPVTQLRSHLKPVAAAESTSYARISPSSHQLRSPVATEPQYNSVENYRSPTQSDQRESTTPSAKSPLQSTRSQEPDGNSPRKGSTPTRPNHFAFPDPDELENAIERTPPQTVEISPTKGPANRFQKFVETKKNYSADGASVRSHETPATVATSHEQPEHADIADDPGDVKALLTNFLGNKLAQRSIIPAPTKEDDAVALQRIKNAERKSTFDEDCEENRRNPPAPPPSSNCGLALKDDPKYERYFRMLKVGMPMEVVKHAMQKDGLDPSIMDGDHNKPVGLPLKEDPKYSKYFKMLKIGISMDQVKHAMERDDLVPEIMDQDHDLPAKTAESRSRKDPKEKATHRRARLHWETVQKVRSNSLWAKLDQDPEISQLDIDEEEFNELFKADLTPALSPKGLGSNRKRGAAVRVIDPKRANNGGIILARLKMSHDEMAYAVDRIDDDMLSPEQIENIIEFLPTRDERRSLEKYMLEGDQSTTEKFDSLCECEKFMVSMMTVTHARRKVQALLFKLQFMSCIESIAEDTTMIEAACDELKNSARLRQLLGIVLQIGNRLNTAGTQDKKKAGAFTLESLLKLNQAKAFDKKTTFLRYVVLIVQRNNNSLLGFDEDLQTVLKADKLYWDQCLSDMEKVESEVDNVRRIALFQAREKQRKEKSGVGGAPDSDDTSLGGMEMEVTEEIAALRTTSVGLFTLNAFKQLSALQEKVRVTGSKFSGLLEYFGQDEKKMQPHDLFRIFAKFTRDFQKEREEAQRAQNKKMREERKHARSQNPSQSGKPPAGPDRPHTGMLKASNLQPSMSSVLSELSRRNTQKPPCHIQNPPILTPQPPSKVQDSAPRMVNNAIGQPNHPSGASQHHTPKNPAHIIPDIAAPPQPRPVAHIPENPVPRGMQETGQLLAPQSAAPATRQQPGLQAQTQVQSQSQVQTRPRPRGQVTSPRATAPQSSTPAAANSRAPSPTAQSAPRSSMMRQKARLVKHRQMQQSAARSNPVVDKPRPAMDVNANVNKAVVKPSTSNDTESTSPSSSSTKSGSGRLSPRSMARHRRRLDARKRLSQSRS